MFDLPPSSARAVAVSTTGALYRTEVPSGLVEPTGWPALAITSPGSGLANAQGLYQFVLFLVLVGQEVKVGLEGSGVPPGAKGSRVMIALAPPPAAVLTFGETENGVPDCAANVRLVDHPPTISSAHLGDWFANARPLPNGNS